MKKIFLAFLIWTALAFNAIAADTKITALTADGSPTTDDLIPTVNDPSGTPANKKVTLADLKTLMTTGLTIGTNVQAYDADLDYLSGFTPTANVKTILNAADYAAIRTALGLTIGTNVQAYDADLTTYAGITPAANVQTFLGAANYAAMKTQLSLTIGTDVQAYDADLTTYAGITPTAAVQDFLDDTWSDDQVWIAASSSAGAPTTIPDCQDSGGNHLNYNQSTNGLSCGTSASGAGGWTDGGPNIYTTTTTDFVGIGTTNPISALQVVGTITATQVSGNGTGPMLMTGGNVGIGTSTAIGTLMFVSTTGGTVDNAGAGDVYIQHNLEVDGTVYMSACSGAGCATAGGWTDGGTNVYTTTTTDTVGIGTTTPNSASLEIVKQGSTPPLKISATASGNGNLLTVTSGGNVGIGTYSPQKKFHIYSTDSSADFQIQDTGSNHYTEGQIWTDQGEALDTGCAGSAVNDGSPNSRCYINQNLNAPLFLQTNGTPRISIIGDGNVGIGTASAGANIVVANSPAHTSQTLCVGTGGCIGYCSGGLAAVCGSCTCLTHP